MLRKTILLVCDGLADRPIKELGGMTPLEAARTPNLDQLALQAECGTMCALGRGKRPGSDTSHLAIMGYDPAKCYSGRGPIEVAGLGMKLQHGDVALRGNFGTVDDKWCIRDRRAGRIRDVSEFADAIDGIKIEDVNFVVRPGTAHRAGVIMRGEGLTDAITDADPHEEGQPIHKVDPKDNSPEASRTAKIVNEYMAEAHQVLTSLPANKAREKAGQLPANFLLLRGAGQYKQLEPFHDKYGLSPCCIAGGGLYKGIGAFLGMDVLDVPGANGLPDTDVEAKFRAAVASLDQYGFVFVHVKAADSLGEDGNYAGKKEFIEKVDQAASLLLNLPEDTLLVVTADHTTPCELHAHSADPVPIMFHGQGVRVDDVSAFNERACAKGVLGLMAGLDVMPQVLNLLGRLPLIGA